MTESSADRLAQRCEDAATYRKLLADEGHGPSLDEIDAACFALVRLVDAAAERGAYLAAILNEDIDVTDEELVEADAELMFHHRVADVFADAGLSESAAYANLATDTLRTRVLHSQRIRRLEAVDGPE